MHVLFVQRQPCIRALKYAIGLRNTNPEIRLSFAYMGKTLTELYGQGDECFENWFPLRGDPATALRNIVSRHDIDVIHSHNLPESLHRPICREDSYRSRHSRSDERERDSL